jgi:hypothetical protein
MNLDKANTQLRSKIQNINKGTASDINSPYVNSYIPNAIDDQGNSLFLTTCLQLHPYDKKSKFSTIALSGYLVDAFYNFNDYNNRIYMNPILLDSTKSYNNFISCLQYNYVGLFDAISDFIETLNLLASGIELYKTLNLVNLTDSSVSTYVDNIEINLPPIPTPLININTIITSLDLGNIKDNQDLTIFTALKSINPNLTDEIITHLEIVNKDNTSCIVKVVQDDVIYYGSVDITYTYYYIYIPINIDY